MKKILILILCLSSYSFAVEEYYGISRSIRSLGMGGAFYTMSDDEYALFYNPAGLSNYRGDGSLMFSMQSSLSSSAPSALSTILDQKGGSIASVVNTLSSFSGKPIHLSLNIFPHYVRKNFAVGLLLADTKTNFAILGKDIDTTVDLTMISDSGLFIGFGRKMFDDDLHLGFNLKGMVRAGGKRSFTVLEIASNTAFDLNPEQMGGVGGGIDFDLGAIYDVRGLPFGILNQVSLTLNNLLASNLTMFKSGTGGNPPGLERMVTLGARTVLPGYGPFDQFNVLLDLSEFHLGGETNDEYGHRGGSFFKHVNMGVEAPINGWFNLRAGFHQGYLTAGFGIQIMAVKLDFATYAEELSTGINRLGSRRFALRLALGAGSSAPPPVPPKTSFTGVKVEEVSVPKNEEKSTVNENAPPLNDEKKLDEKKPEEKKEEDRKPKSVDEGEGKGLDSEEATPEESSGPQSLNQTEDSLNFTVDVL
jgi:hypothetical protein